MARRRNFKVIAAASIAIIVISVLYFNVIPNPVFNTNPSTGTFMRGCLYDLNGNQLGCQNSVSILAQSPIIGVFGAGVIIGKVGIPSAYVKINYTGLVQTPASSWTYVATEKVDYQKGASQSFPIQMSGNGNPPKTFNVTLPQSSWTTSQLVSQWGSSYGSKVMNVTLVGQTISLNLVSGLKISKPSANNFVVQFQLSYGAPLVTTSSSSTSVSSSTSTTISSSSTTMTSTTTVTSTSTTISGGGVTTGTTDAWLTTITSASGGLTGNLASNGIIATLAPDFYFPTSQSVVWVYYSDAAFAQCPQGIFVSVVTPSTSVTVGRLPVYSNTWSGSISVPMVVTSGNPYLLQVLCADSASTLLFNQVVTASAAQTNAAYGANLPPPPFDAQYIATLAPPAPTTTTITSATYSTWIDTDGATNSACYSGGVRLASPKPCYPPLSIISVTF